MLDRLENAAVTRGLSDKLNTISEFQIDSGRTWAESAGVLANATRSAWHLMNGTVSMVPVGTVTHTLDETQGTLSLSSLQLSMVKALANDVTVCGGVEPCAYVTEFFEGDGTTTIFDLTEEPWTPPVSRRRPLVDVFEGSSINTQLWTIADPSGALSLTGNGLTCAGGSGYFGSVSLSALSNLELSGSLVLELAGVQFGVSAAGILNGIYNSGWTDIVDCIAGFQLTQPNGVTTICALTTARQRAACLRHNPDIRTRYGYVSARMRRSGCCRATTPRTIRAAISASGMDSSTRAPPQCWRCRTRRTEWRECRSCSIPDRSR
jgi:hypothetical protein